MDKYSCFRELSHNENDFELDFSDRNASVTILAPHGGRIEPYTTELARLIAGEDYNYFCFNGRKEGCNNDLHITSHRYDVRQALILVEKSLTVITVHGCTRDEPILFLGGLDANIKNRIAAELKTTNIVVDQLCSAYGGKHKNNICNRGTTGKGVQLECSRPLRNLAENRLTLARAIRHALDSSLKDY